MTQFILRENVLTDNILLLSDEGKVFKGNYIAIIKEYAFANAWNDYELPNKKFRSKDSLLRYIKRNYKDFDLIDLI